MKKHFIAYSIPLLLSIYSCKDKSEFKIEGKISNPGEVKKAYLLRADTSQVSVIDSAELKGGSFSFKSQSPTANLFKLRIGGSIFDLIAKNGDDINFETNLTDEAHTYHIKGSQESEKIKEFNTFSNSFGEKNAKLVTEFQSKAQGVKNQDSLLKVYQPVLENNLASYSNEVIKFVNDNKSSLAAFYAAMSLDPYKYEQQLVSYADDIKGKFNDNASVQQFIRQMEAAKPLAIGHAAPNFTIKTIEGKTVSLSDYKGKYVMLDFWASWCAPCRQENPNVVKLYNKFKSKGLNILGISLDEEKSAWQKAISDDNLAWAHASDLQKFDGPTEHLYRIEAIPSNFIIDPQGKIVAKNITGQNLEEFFNKTFAQL